MIYCGQVLSSKERFWWKKTCLLRIVCFHQERLFLTFKKIQSQKNIFFYSPFPNSLRYAFFCQTRYIPFIGVGKKELFKDCTDSSLWKKIIFSLVWKFRKYFIVALIFISKHSLWQYKPPKFPSKFVSIVEKTTFAMRLYFVGKTFLKTVKEVKGWNRESFVAEQVH